MTIGGWVWAGDFRIRRPSSREGDVGGGGIFQGTAHPSAVTLRRSPPQSGQCRGALERAGRRFRERRRDALWTPSAWSGHGVSRPWVLLRGAAGECAQSPSCPSSTSSALRLHDAVVVCFVLFLNNGQRAIAAVIFQVERSSEHCLLVWMFITGRGDVACLSFGPLDCKECGGQRRPLPGHVGGGGALCRGRGGSWPEGPAAQETNGAFQNGAAVHPCQGQGPPLPARVLRPVLS